MVSKKFTETISLAYTIKDKKSRQEKLKEIHSSLENLSEETGIELKKISNAISKLQKNIVQRKNLIFQS